MITPDYLLFYLSISMTNKTRCIKNNIIFQIKNHQFSAYFYKNIQKSTLLFSFVPMLPYEIMKKPLFINYSHQFYDIFHIEASISLFIIFLSFIISFCHFITYVYSTYKIKNRQFTHCSI